MNIVRRSHERAAPYLVAFRLCLCGRRRCGGINLQCSGGQSGPRRLSLFFAWIEAFRLKNWDSQNARYAAGRCGCWA